MVIGTSPVIGDHTRFVVPMDVYFDDQSDLVPIEFRIEDMAELGITLLLVV